MKKILALILIIITLFSQSAFASSLYSDVESGAYFEDAVEALSIYGIVSGYGGKFSPYDNVTRAEFAKIAAISGGYDSLVAARAKSTRFNDVSVDHWANGYINVASEKALIVGYPNGYYMPENNITYQEAVTIVLRLLDYTSKDLGDNWPYSYMEKGRALGLLDGMNIVETYPITRADLSVIIDRALKLDLNNSNTQLASKLKLKTTDELILIATKNEDKSLAFDTIKTSLGNYTVANDSLKLTPLTKGKLVLDDNGEVINYIMTYQPKIVSTTISTVTDDIVYFANGTNSSSLSIKDSTPCYNEGNISNFKAVKANMQNGANVSFAYEKDGSVGYVILNNMDYGEAHVVRTKAAETLENLGASSSSKIIRDGLKASVDEIQIFDVCYYQKDNDTVYVYSDKISGVYEEAYPSKASVSSVDISGNILQLETQSAAYKLGENPGSYALNQRITALLGKDGKIVDVVDLSNSASDLYGVLLSVESKIEGNSQETFINVLTASGNNLSYKTLQNCSNKIGCVGKIGFNDDGYATFTVQKETVVFGDVDKENNKIGTKWLSAECKIIEILYVPENRTGTAKAQVIDIDDLGSTLTKAQCVFYATGGSFGDINALFVTDVTGGGYEYGILKSGRMLESQNDISGSYEVFTENGMVENLSTSYYANINSGAGVKMIREGSRVVDIKALTSLKSGAVLKAIDYGRIKVGDSVYTVSNGALIALKTSSGYRKLSVEDAQDYIGNKVRIYSDSNISNKKDVKVIIIER